MNFVRSEFENTQRPPPLVQASQAEVFLRSLFEVGHPTEYAHRARWTLDQGNAFVAFRSGGFWNVAVATYLVVALALLLALRRRKGAVVALSAVAVLSLVALTPQSHELRYFMFIPLAGAGIVGMLYPLLRARWPLLGLSLLLLVPTLFLYVSRINISYYRAERIDYQGAAKAWGADVMWPYLRPGYTYCAVRGAPTAIFLTGPTMREFSVVDRFDEANCPRGSVPVRGKMVYYGERK